MKVVMRLQRLCGAPSVLLLSFCIFSVLFQVSGLPQWVWNKDVIDNTRFGNDQSQPNFASHSTRFPASSQFANDAPNSNIRVVGVQRTFPGAISAISNSLSGSGSGGGGGGSSGISGLGGVFGGIIQTIPQLATQALGGLFSRPITLPAKIPDFGSGSNSGNSGSSGSSGSGIPTTGSCKCVSQNSCFLPFTATGSCEGGRIQCCSTSRTVFPDSSSSQSTKSERTVTQSQIRRGLLQQILKGSGSIVDDTLDLILTPYLSTEDQQRIATRVID